MNGVNTIPHNEVSGWRIQSLSVEFAAPEDSCIMYKTWISHKDVKESTIPITYCLHLNGWKELPVNIFLASSPRESFDVDMASIYVTHTLTDYGVVS